MTLDGRSSGRIYHGAPAPEFVFTDVAHGMLTIEVKDAAGFTDAAEVVVLTPAPKIPDWLASLIHRFEGEPVSNPPASITRYEYNGQTVYFVPKKYRDICSDPSDSDGVNIGRPDGGIAGTAMGGSLIFLSAKGVNW